MKLNIKRNCIILIILSVMTAAIVSGCGTGASKTTAEDQGGAPVRNAVSNNKSVKFSESAINKNEVKIPTAANTGRINNSIKKIVKNANVSMRVTKIDETFLKISGWAEDNDGYEFSRNESVNGKYKNIYVVFKIPPEKLNAFIEFLKKTGKVINSTTSGEDITDQYYDIAARLDNLIKGRDQLLEIQKKAVTIDDTLKVQNELNNITGQIESLQGRISMWDKMVAESTISISIDEEADSLKPGTEISWKFSSFTDVWNTMKNGFILVTNTVVSILTWIIILAISILPLAIIVFGIIILIRYINKRKKKMQTK